MEFASLDLAEKRVRMSESIIKAAPAAFPTK